MNLHMKASLALISVLLLGGCGSMQPASYTYEDSREISSGPGLLTGKTGAFVLYRKTE